MLWLHNVGAAFVHPSLHLSCMCTWHTMSGWAAREMPLLVRRRQYHVDTVQVLACKTQTNLLITVTGKEHQDTRAALHSTMDAAPDIAALCL